MSFLFVCYRNIVLKNTLSRSARVVKVQRQVLFYSSACFVFFFLAKLMTLNRLKWRLSCIRRILFSCFRVNWLKHKSRHVNIITYCCSALSHSLCRGYITTLSGPAFLLNQSWVLALLSLTMKRVNASPTADVLWVEVKACAVNINHL